MLSRSPEPKANLKGISPEKNMILVVSNRSHFLPELLHGLHRLGVAHDLLLSDQGRPPRGFGRYTGIILSGGTLLIRHPRLLASGLRYLRETRLDVESTLEADVPVLGICLGHLILCDVFGAKLGRLPEMVDGSRRIQVLDEDLILAGLAESVKVREAHMDTVTSLPQDFQWLATSDSARYEAVRHRVRPLFGVQFHPEASGVVGQRVLTNFLGACGEAAFSTTAEESHG